MSFEYNRQIAALKPSASMVLMAKAKAMKAEDPSIIDLAGGEPDFDTPDRITMEAVRQLYRLAPREDDAVLARICPGDAETLREEPVRGIESARIGRGVVTPEVDVVPDELRMRLERLRRGLTLRRASENDPGRDALRRVRRPAHPGRDRARPSRDELQVMRQFRGGLLLRGPRLRGQFNGHLAEIPNCGENDRGD